VGALIDLNSASVEELVKRLDGIGVHRARAIVAARPFTDAREVIGRGIITEEGFGKIVAHVTVMASG
jgi:DNA uptake protein ComE-like DNA-binding protein